MMPSGYQWKSENKKKSASGFPGSTLGVGAFPKEAALGLASCGHFFWEHPALPMLPYT